MARARRFETLYYHGFIKGCTVVLLKKNNDSIYHWHKFRSVGEAEGFVKYQIPVASKNTKGVPHVTP